MDALMIAFYILWLVVLLTALIVWVPAYVEDKYKDITVHFIVLGFTFIAITGKFISHVSKNELDVGYILLYALSIAILLVAVTGVYYWMPKYYPEGVKDPITGKADLDFANTILLSCFTITLIFLNLYEQEYTESIYKSGEVTSTLINFGGRRRK
jgi:heme/copper-type cytochrome/quinol oxidase subunit 4